MVSNPEPPDGGWGWVIVLCGFINHIFTVGLMMSLSVFYVSWLDQFGESKRDTSWIISIGAACMFGLSPIPAFLGVRFGFRVVAVIGGLLTSSGLILSVFATSISYLVVTIGLITGIGCCFSFLPAMATVAMYFDRRRALAMGLNTAGTGIGAFVLAPLLNLLEEMYGWRGAILLLAAITLHMCVTGLLMRDLGSESEYEIVEGALESDNENERREASEGLVEDHHLTDLVANPMTKVIRDGENNFKDHGSSPRLNIQSPSDERDKEMDESPRDALSHRPNNLGNDLHASHGDVGKSLLPVSKTDHSRSFPNLNERTFGGNKCVHQPIARSVQNMNLALLASIPSLLNKRERLGVSSPHDSNVHITESTAGVRQHSETSKHNRTSVSRILSSKTVKANLELLTNKVHVAFCISNFITNLSFITPVVFMVDRAVYQGISKSAGAILVSANGIGNVTGRMFFGYMAYRFQTKHISMYITALTVCGVCTMLSDLCGNIIVLHAAYAFLFGFLMGTYIVLAPIVSVDLTGVSVFATAYGQTLAFMGVATIFGPPLAGGLFDWTQSYLLSYLTIGFFFVVSGVMLLPLLCRSNDSDRRRSSITLTPEH